MTRGGVLGGLLLGSWALYGVALRHATIYPDTSEYAHGRAWWSSPLTALAGTVGGDTGVRAVAVVGAIAVGYLLARHVTSWSLAVGGVALVALVPPGWALAFAGADALGVAAVLFVYDNGKGAARGRGLVVAGAAHLVGGLCVGAALALRRVTSLGVAAPLYVAGMVAMLAEPLLGLLTGAAFTQLQWRYLLPAVAVTVRRELRRVAVVA